MTFTTGNGGTMKFDFKTGAWTYKTGSSVSSQFVEPFTYKITDGDGDQSASATLNITVSPPPVPPTVSISNGTTSAALANDATPDFAAVQEGDYVFFQVKLSGIYSQDVTVKLDTHDDDRIERCRQRCRRYRRRRRLRTSEFEYSVDGGQNWLAATGPGDDQVKIPSGNTSIIVRIKTEEDTSNSENSVEGFRVSIAQVTPAVVVIATGHAADGGFGGVGEANIVDDDDTPEIDGGEFGILQRRGKFDRRRDSDG